MLAHLCRRSGFTSETQYEIQRLINIVRDPKTILNLSKMISAVKDPWSEQQTNRA